MISCGVERCKGTAGGNKGAARDGAMSDDFQRDGVITWSLLRHQDSEPLLILDPLQLALVSEKLDVLNFRRRQRTAGCELLDEGELLRPPHDKCIQRVAPGGEADFFGC